LSAAIAIERTRYTRSARDFWCVGVRHGGWFGVVVVVEVVEVVEVVAWEGQFESQVIYSLRSYRFGARALVYIGGQHAQKELPLPLAADSSDLP
jgi:hypothetical protein